MFYDDELRIEAYRFEGIVQPFPNHFHEYYVIGFIEDGQRILSCRNQKYTITKGDIVLFNPGDNHACVQSDNSTLDYRGFLALLIVYPRPMKETAKRQEIVFAAAGLCANFFIGFIVAVIGICLISFNGTKIHLNPIGDLLAVAAAVVWACYSVLTRKISGFGYHTIQATRRIFAYGILFMIPALFLSSCRIGAERFANPVYLGNLIFLGLGASALCFVTWNMAVKILGAIKTSIYIYLVPVITVVTSALILKEKITVMSGIGTVLALIGLFLSEYRGKTQKQEEI